MSGTRLIPSLNPNGIGISNSSDEEVFELFCITELEPNLFSGWLGFSEMSGFSGSGLYIYLTITNFIHIYLTVTIIFTYLTITIINNKTNDIQILFIWEATQETFLITQEQKRSFDSLQKIGN